MLTKNLLLLKSYTSLNIIDSTNGTVGVCVIIFLPYDWVESNNPFHNELKERRINHHFSKHNSCLLAECAGPTAFYLIVLGKLNLFAKFGFTALVL